MPMPGAIHDAGLISATVFPGNDDGSTHSQSLGFNINFYGTNFNSLFVNNNGNVSSAPPMEHSP